MPEPQSTIITALLEQLITTGTESLGQVFTALFDLAMPLERERHLGAERYKRSPERRSYANGYKPKTLETPAGTLTVQVPKTRDADELFYPQSLERGRRSCWDGLRNSAKPFSTKKLKSNVPPEHPQK
jgi:putative transposase